MKGIEYLRKQLTTKRTRVLQRYQYYEMKNHIKDFNISTPPKLRRINMALGWCAKSVDTLADRIVFDSFRNDNFAMGEIYNMNNPDVLFDSAVLSAMISSCCFIYISADEDGYPRLQVIDGANATGITEPITGMLEEGYAVLKRDENDKVLIEAYFTTGRTDFYDKENNITYSVENSAPYPLLVPIVYRPDARRPFGHSRISRASISIVDSALRTAKRSEVSAEFFSFPQKYVVGLDKNVEIIDRWTASMSAMMTFSTDKNGNKPTLGQFQQESMSPHLDQLKMWASLFAGETGLTLDDLGFATENPSSAEAIKASHENLRLTARKAQRTFASGFINAGYLAACLRDEFPYRRRVVYETTIRWKPIFEPDAAMLSGIGDGAIKINQAIPGYLNNEAIEDLTGIKGGDGNGSIIE